ncbi:collagen alpha-2(I) chain-like [Pararge aegeria]|uniref:collagen alpha-2(I) chain-like n=1 Tax=Pararge aegeria TaxID=116150 RepID=UPI0019D1AC5B|nr:collagen alpha-2(I) chain-like [Pararge aegeria]
MIIGSLQCALLLMALTSSAGERWRWPDAEGAESVRIDTKVGFVDDQGNSKRNNRGNIQADEITFQQPTDTQGFYNRPPGNGRYPVRVERVRDDPDIRINGRPAPNNGGHTNEKYQDGTLDSLQYCKCASTPDCEVRTDYAKACDANQYLCCYNDPGKQNGLQSEFFNEVDDERPMLFPGQSSNAGPFSSTNYDNNAVISPGYGHGSFQSQSGLLTGPGGPTGINGPERKPVLVGPGGPTGIIGPQRKPVLVGPGGPTGVIGPQRKPVLVGPGGPTGVIGPGGHNEVGNSGRPVLVGPGGPTGVIGPDYDKPYLVGPGGSRGERGHDKQILVGPSGPTGVVGPERPVLVGPGGPTGIIGPANDDRNDNLLVRPLERPGDIRQSESAQRGVLVGPGGPTGIIGPAFNRPFFYGSGFNRPVLVGPSGPTGIIGPRLVGPGGPTGIIGPDFNRQSRGRGVLVGPGGPTGRIGPRNFFGCAHRKNNQNKATGEKLSKKTNRTQFVCTSQSHKCNKV